jgi:glutathione peroxidase-family protein
VELAGFSAVSLRGVEIPLASRSVKWNFTKFLIDRQGRPVQRFAPITPPGRIEPAIQRLLAS